MRPLQRALLAGALGCAGLPAAGHSEIIEPGHERFSVSLGWFLSAFDTHLRVDNPTLGEGTPIDLHDDVGVDRNTSAFWADVQWRFASRHRIEIAYSRFTVNGSKLTEGPIQIGDEIYDAGSTISAEISTEIVPITYSFSFMKREKNELAAVIGVHWSREGLVVQGSSAGSTSTDNFDASNETSADADLPLPVLGLRYDHHFSPRWSAGGQAGFFGVNTSDLDGTLWTARGYGECRFSRYVGLGLAVDAFNLRATANMGSWTGDVDYAYWGPQLYLKARY
jgi:hypothetical protein